MSEAVPVLRRSSGGGTVLLGRGCLCYSLVLAYARHPALREIPFSYVYILEHVRSALHSLLPGIERAGTSDLMANGCKFSGTAQQLQAPSPAAPRNLAVRFRSRRGRPLPAHAVAPAGVPRPASTRGVFAKPAGQRGRSPTRPANGLASPRGDHDLAARDRGLTDGREVFADTMDPKTVRKGASPFPHVFQKPGFSKKPGFSSPPVRLLEQTLRVVVVVPAGPQQEPAVLRRQRVAWVGPSRISPWSTAPGRHPRRPEGCPPIKEDAVPSG